MFKFGSRGAQHSVMAVATHYTWALYLIMILLLQFTLSQDLQPLVPIVGHTLCTFLAGRHMLHKKNFGACSKPSCSWDTWSHATNGTDVTHTTEIDFSSSSSQRVVLSYGHNGFGNMLWSHTVAFMVAESLKARLFITMIPHKLCFDGAYPPHTWEGQEAMNKLLPDEFEYHLLPKNSSIRKLCEEEDFVLLDRPRDWRNGTYNKLFRQTITNIVSDKKPRCLKMLGYFQNLPLCKDDTIRLWTPKMLEQNQLSPGPNDISVYLRCLPRHYHFNGPEFYDTILSHTNFEKVWLFQAPDCPSKLGADESKDNIVQKVMRLLKQKYNATRWPARVGEIVKTEDSQSRQLLHDLTGLVRSKKLILPVSSWAFWGGFLSNATEIHVNAPPHHQLMSGRLEYVYHHEKDRKFFGRQSTKYEFDIDYEIDLKTLPTASPTNTPVPTVLSSSSSPSSLENDVKSTAPPSQSFSVSPTILDDKIREVVSHSNNLSNISATNASEDPNLAKYLEE